MTEAELQLKMGEFAQHLLIWGWARHPDTGETWVNKVETNSFLDAIERRDLDDLGKRIR